MFTCPNCAHVAGEYPTAGVLIVVCAQCTFKYELSGGRATAFTSRQVELRPATHASRAAHARHYELTVAISRRETLRFTFGTERDDAWIRIAPGALVVVVYNMRGEERDELLFVVNRTSGERFILGKPGAQSKTRASALGVVAAVVVGLGAVALSAPLIVAAAGALIGGIATWKGAEHLLMPKHTLASDAKLTLGARQRLLGERKSLLQLREDVLSEMEDRHALTQRLSDLRSKMVAVQLDAYTMRIVAIDSALKTLDAQLDVDAQLVAEYDRTLQIMAIEYESSLAADALPEDGVGVIDDRLAELRHAEELRAETTRRLAANAEVEELLRTHGS
ncbi:MAG: hypothetical protein ABI969_00980 [bacterium]